MNVEGVNIVTIGGGTGSFTLLSALKKYVNNITAIVNMADDGGSTGKLRDELGVLPPGDIRQCLVALSDDTSVVRELFNYRFGEGDLSGHSFGNLFLTALEKTTGDFGRAVETASDVLNVRGRVVPVTLDEITLVYTSPEGERVEGEFQVAEADLTAAQGKPELSLSPAGKINPAAAHAIKQADMVVICPGNLYGSIAPALLVNGVKDALQNTHATVVYVCNLVTKPGQTSGMTVADYADEIERFAGEGVLDYVLYNTEKPSKELLERYAKEKELPVDYDETVLKEKHYKAKGGNFVSQAIHSQDPNDKAIQRTLIRHDADKIARQLMKIYFS